MADFNYSFSVTGDCSLNETGAITLTMSGGTPPYTVEWITPYVATFYDVDNSVTIENLFSDVYYVRVNDSTAPVNQEFYINIPVSSGLCIDIVSVSGTTCGLDNGSVTVTSTTYYSSIKYYLYTTEDEFISSAVTNTLFYTFGSLSADSYYIIGEDLGGCTAKTSDFIIEDSTELDYGLYIVPNASCGNGSIGKIYVTGITGSPPYTYLWNNGFTGSSITGLTSGIYQVQVTDSFGCTKSKTATIENIEPIGLGSFNVEPPTCFTNDGSITIIITGGTAPYYYSASTGNVSVSYNPSYTITGLTSGVVTFLITDAAFCKVEESINLISAGGINSVNVNTINSSCSDNDGIIQVVVDGGTAPYTYTLILPDGSTQNTTNNLSNYSFIELSGGTYSISVEDSTGCSYIEEVFLITENKFTISAQTSGTTCNLNNGQIYVEVYSGYTLPINYSIDGVSILSNSNLTATTISDLSNGLHILSVTDFTGCEQSENILIEGSSDINFSLYGTSCLDGSGGTITVFISSGVPPFTYYWSDNVQSNPQQIYVTGLTAGTYSLTVEDSTGCSMSKDINIECNSLLSSYQTYVIGEEIFNIQTLTKCGILQMLNEGFVDLTSGNTGCNLVSAEFFAKVSVNPIGYTNEVSFFVSNSLINVPSDDLWYSTIETLISAIPGVGSVTIDYLNNQIKVETVAGNLFLNNQEILVELIIIYDINCHS